MTRTTMSKRTIIGLSLMALVLATVALAAANESVHCSGPAVPGLSGLNENPANTSPASGMCHVFVDTDAHTLTVDTTFMGLTAGTTAAHIHCCVDLPGNAAVAMPFVGFPLGVTGGSYLSTFDTTIASSYSQGFVAASGGTVAGAEAALALGIAQGRAYLNIHTTTFPGGEIRGFLQLTQPPAITALTAEPNVIWPPNKQMVPVRLSVVVEDDSDPAPVCRITEVSSNERVTVPAWTITGPLTLSLLADRNARGRGRIYTITVTCTNSSGLSSSETVTVSVPHDQR